jgi:Acetoacetate decarboxylase (ADC)
MRIPSRLRDLAGRYARVDGIPFRLPVSGSRSRALLAIYTIDAGKARDLLPSSDIHPLRLWGERAPLVIVVVDYHVTDIGPYIEFNVSIPCTHGKRPAPRLLPALLGGPFDAGQYVIDLPVSTEISVKGGKGIWGMPKHQANLDFVVDAATVSSQYDLDGRMVMRIDVPRPRAVWLPLGMGGVNFCQFRGMLFKSSIAFRGTFGPSLVNRRAQLVLGDHPRARPLAELDVSSSPLLTAYATDVSGVLDDHVESWFLSYDQPPTQPVEGLESVAGLGLSQAWLPPPERDRRRPTPVPLKVER